VIEILGGGSRGALAFALDVALKATFVLALMMLVHLALRRRRTLLCSVLWNATLGGLLLLPVAVAGFPQLRIRWLPAEPAARELLPRPTPSVVPQVAVEAPALVRLTLSQERPRPAPILSRVNEPALPPPTHSRTFDWALLALSIYGLGVLVLAVRLTRSLAAVAALRRSSERVDDSLWLERLDYWRRRLGIRRTVALARSECVGVPVLVGGLRPMVVLPASLDVFETPSKIDAVLLHELSHARRGDYGWNLVLKLVQIVYWPHPLIWPLKPLLRDVREQACDDLCIRWLGDDQAYRTTLLDVAAGLLHRPDPALGMAMARISGLERRLTRIAASEGAPRCQLWGPARVGFAVLVLAAAGLLGSVRLARAVASPERASQEPAKGEEPAQKKEEATKPVEVGAGKKNKPRPQDQEKKGAGDSGGDARNEDSIAAPPPVGSGPISELFYNNPQVAQLVQERDRAQQTLKLVKRSLAKPEGDPLVTQIEKQVKSREQKINQLWKDSMNAHALEVQTFKPLRGFRLVAGARASVKAYEPVSIPSKVFGVVKQRMVESGERVRKGQPLAEIDAPELEGDVKAKTSDLVLARAQLRQAEAALRVAKAGLTVQEAKTKGAKVDLDRAASELSHLTKQLERLRKLKESNSINETVLEEAQEKKDDVEFAVLSAKTALLGTEGLLVQSRDQVDAADAGLDAAKQRVARATADLELVSSLLAFTTVVAPIDGVVIQAHADTNSLVRPDTAQALFTLARTDKVTLKVNLPGNLGEYVDQGDPAEFHLESVSPRTYRGRVSRSAWGYENNSHTLPLEIDLDNPDGRLRPGQTGRVTLTLEDHPNSWTIRWDSVVNQDPQSGEPVPPYCVCVQDGKAVKKPIKTGLGGGGGFHTEVLEGLEGEEHVVANPGQYGARLFDKTPLRETYQAENFNYGRLQ